MATPAEILRKKKAPEKSDDKKPDDKDDKKKPTRDAMLEWIAGAKNKNAGK